MDDSIRDSHIHVFEENYPQCGALARVDKSGIGQLIMDAFSFG